jgi:hypothetical protein
MALVQRDFIVRMIEAVAAAIARSLRRRQDGDHRGARAEIAAATAQVLGSAGTMASLVDTRTAVDIVSDPARVALWARLLIEDAFVLREMSRDEDGRASDRRALMLLLELRHRGAELPDTDVALIHETARRIPLSDLPEPYRSYAAALAD